MRDRVGAANLPDNYTGTEIEFCPGTSARNWQNDAYSPRTGLLYTVVNTSCARWRFTEGEYVPGQGYNLQVGAGNVPPRWFGNEEITFAAQIQANNPLYNQDGGYRWPDAPGGTEWAITFEQLTDAPIMATAADLLFTGDTTTGRFMAIDATNGEIAWSFRVGQSFQGSPITYIGPDGRQYIAVIGSGETTANVDPNAAPNADERYWRAGSNLYVFALPQGIAAN
jgi:lanthanide-dependent methanol dehydrogenase